MNISTRKHWEIMEKVPEEVADNLKDYPPLLQQLLFNRKIENQEQAENYLKAYGSIYDPFFLKDMDKAIACLEKAIDSGQEIAVYGDYDVDGVTATVLLVQLLQSYGVKARGYIPNRFDEGYGVNIDALDALYKDGIKTIITVDCGIRSPREAEYARSMGIDLIISDHHEPEREIPDCKAVICPKQPEDKYPERNLAGVGLAYKIAEALLSRRPIYGVSAADWLDLVAVGTVADMVPLTGENRSLVKAGLQKIRQGIRPGLCSIANIAELNVTAINSHHIGFVLGPRLNAAGRLESALDAYELLMQKDINSTGLLAQKLDDQNRQRQELTRQMQEEAEIQVGENIGNELLFVIHPDFNMGVVGLVASRLTEEFYRPTVVASKGLDFTRGSCRSIPEFHITQALDQCADLLVRHGGHSMAAGFTIDNKNTDKLRERLAEISRKVLEGKDLKPVLKADAEIFLSDLRPGIFSFLEALEPTGLGNPGAAFVTRNVQVINYREVGSEKKHLKLTIRGDGVVFDGIAFRQGYWAGQLPKNIDLFFAFEKNYFNGRETLQLNIRDIKPANQPD